ncbi:hypothetical protein [Thioalkalivibrio sp. AKL17]|uniref:hypothetical protein n=1 Tax=Thioalkalivibrio sp. AKL17 TaxID=1158160 RepID=UPI001FCB3A06|nr:hypothetical protein [Thioalkalivibrio sp. AKL17]
MAARDARRRRLTLTAAACCCGVILALGYPALAVADPERDLRVATRALSFLDHRPSGDMPVAVVYAAGDSASEDHARRMADAMGDGGPQGRIRLVPTLMAADDLGALDRQEAVLIADGLADDQAAEVFSAASRRGLITIASDMACVDEGHCVMAVASEPRVQIVVSRDAARASDVGFASSFRMMITER